MSNTYFEFKRFTIQQDKCSFKVTTDSCLLGAYVDFLKPARICDIGTGTGVLALMLAQKFSDAIIDAVEIDPISSGQALKNVNASPWKDRVFVYNESIQAFSKANRQKYDLIISNPPYFENHLKSSDSRKNLARHNLRLSMAELAEISANVLDEKGRFYTILPQVSFHRLVAQLQTLGFYLNDLLEIFIYPEKPLYRIIGGFGRQKNQRRGSSLFIYRQKSEYTPEFRNLLRDYYLAF